nr:HEXXH motif domain-containing protein [Micromonospora sp. DSM 115978]
MNFERHRLTTAQIHSIAAGHGLPDAIEVLAASQRSKRRVLLLSIVQQARATGEHLSAVVEAAVGLLTAAERVRPGAVRAVLAHPFLDNWASSWLRRLAQAGPAAAHDADLRAGLGYLSALAVSAAVRAGLPFEHVVHSRDGVVMLPTLGTASGLGAGEVVIVGDGLRLTLTGPRRTVVTALGDPGRGWEPVRQIRVGNGPDGHVLAIEDLDPHRDCYQWRPTDRLDEADAARFAQLCRRAWALIAAEHPEHAAGMRRALISVTPLEPSDDGTSQGATSDRASGSLAVSVASDPQTLALSMVHEFQHMKLFAVTELVDLHRPAGQDRYFAPWRADPRPLHALLHGVYAHTGVCDYWRRRRVTLTGETGRAAHFEFALWHRLTSLAIDGLLASPELTELGRQFVMELRRTLQTWGREPLPADIGQAASDAGLAYLVQWRLNNGTPTAEEVHRLAAAARPDWLPVDPVAAVRAWRRSAEPAAGPAEPALARAIRTTIAGAAPIRANDSTTGSDPELRDADNAYLAARYADAAAAYAVAIEAGCSGGWVGFAVASVRSGAMRRGQAERVDIVRRLYEAAGGRAAPAEVAAWWLALPAR